MNRSGASWQLSPSRRPAVRVRNSSPSSDSPLTLHSASKWRPADSDNLANDSLPTTQLKRRIAINIADNSNPCSDTSALASPTTLVSPTLALASRAESQSVASSAATLSDARLDEMRVIVEKRLDAVEKESLRMQGYSREAIKRLEEECFAEKACAESLRCGLVEEMTQLQGELGAAKESLSKWKGEERRLQHEARALQCELIVEDQRVSDIQRNCYQLGSTLDAVREDAESLRADNARLNCERQELRAESTRGVAVQQALALEEGEVEMYKQHELDLLLRLEASEAALQEARDNFETRVSKEAATIACFEQEERCKRCLEAKCRQHERDDGDDVASTKCGLERQETSELLGRENSLISEVSTLRHEKAILKQRLEDAEALIQALRQEVEALREDASCARRDYTKLAGLCTLERQRVLDAGVQTGARIRQVWEQLESVGPELVHLQKRLDIASRCASAAASPAPSVKGGLASMACNSPAGAASNLLTTGESSNRPQSSSHHCWEYWSRSPSVGGRTEAFPSGGSFAAVKLPTESCSASFATPPAARREDRGSLGFLDETSGQHKRNPSYPNASAPVVSSRDMRMGVTPQWHEWEHLGDREGVFFADIGSGRILRPLIATVPKVPAVVAAVDVLGRHPCQPSGSADVIDADGLVDVMGEGTRAADVVDDDRTPSARDALRISILSMGFSTHEAELACGRHALRSLPPRQMEASSPVADGLVC